MAFLKGLPRAFRAAFQPVALVLLLAAAVGLWQVGFRGATEEPAAQPPLPDEERFLFLEFGTSADAVVLASAADPRRRQALLTVPHAPEFGIVASLSPDRRSLAYTALPPDTSRPAADAPAGLWLAPLDGSAAPSLLAAGLDLLVRPVWSPTGDALVFRRSLTAADRAGEFSLHLVTTSGEERHLVYSPDTALFPVAFSPDGASLYYVTLSTAGSDLHALDLRRGATERLARLAPDLTRDWALSPDGSRLAYLALDVTRAFVASRALVLDLATDEVEALPGSGRGDEFSPVWRPDGGALAIGRLLAGNAGSGVVVTAGEAFPAPPSGFDVPAGWSSGGRLAVRSFAGASLARPGDVVLMIIDAAGRRAVARGEVTFLGWL
jgi:hypothetical protein